MLSEKQQTDPDYTERYNAYRIRRCINRFIIFDDRSKGPCICEARDLTPAREWIDAYRAGEQWAIAKRTKYEKARKRNDDEKCVELTDMPHELSSNEVADRPARHPLGAGS
jgi:hypothetical protein